MRKIIIAVAAALALGMPLLPVMSGTAAAGATCADRSSCFYPSTGFSGTPLTVLNTSNENTWTLIPSGDRESVWEQGGSDLWLWDRQDAIYTCVKANGNGISDESPLNSGYYYIDYGVTQNCTEAHPSGAPGS